MMRYQQVAEKARFAEQAFFVLNQNNAGCQTK